MNSDINKLALVGDVWYQIMEVNDTDEEVLYRLYTKDYLIPKSWIKAIKER